MGSRARFEKVWSRVPRTGVPKGLRASNDWVAVVDQHHRMVQALTMAAPVRPSQLPDREPTT